MNSDAKIKLNSRDWLFNHYITLNQSILDLSKELNVDKNTIRKYLKKFNIIKEADLVNRNRFESLQKTMLQTYGVDHPSKSKKILDKTKETNLERYGVKSTLSDCGTQAKIRKTLLDIYGVDNPQQNKTIRDKTADTNMSRYGNSCALRGKDTLEKTLITLLEKYGVDNVSKSDIIKKRKIKTSINRFGVEHPMQSPSILKTFKEEFFGKWGVWNPSQLNWVKEKIHETKLENGSYGTSQSEEDLYLLLHSMYQEDIDRQYSEDLRYPFPCDFHVDSLELFIELQGYWSHGTVPYNGRNTPLDWEEKALTSDHYKNAVKVYTETDPLKRMYASLYCLNYLEIWMSDIQKGWDWVEFLLSKQGLPLYFSEQELQTEFKNISEQEGSFERSPNQNRIIKYFQPHFFRKERELWNHPKIREDLIANREKYKFKDKSKLTNQEILAGFKISGAHVGYSFFSPHWIKSFIDKYKVKSVYDPCMGWGHRLLGAKDITYIGNDICTETYLGNKKISEYFSMEDKTFYNNPAEDFIPEESFEAVFTCPPYFDVEIYDGEYTSTTKYKDYDSWLNVWWRKVVQNCLVRNPKYFSFVINNKYKEDMKKVCLEEGLQLLEEISVGKNIKNHFQRSSANTFKGESLLIFKN